MLSGNALAGVELPQAEGKAPQHDGTGHRARLRQRLLEGGAEALADYEVLEYLLRNKNATVTRDMLGRDVWKEPGIGLTNVVEVYITHLRRKVERPDRRPLIHTVRGVGYRLEG